MLHIQSRSSTLKSFFVVLLALSVVTAAPIPRPAIEVRAPDPFVVPEGSNYPDLPTTLINGVRVHALRDLEIRTRSPTVSSDSTTGERHLARRAVTFIDPRFMA